MPTAAIMMANTAALMNDPNQVSYTNAKLLPYLKMAYQDLQLRLVNLGHPSRLDTSAETTIAAGDDSIDPPDDLVAIISIEERAVGSEDNGEWQVLTQHRMLPDNNPGNTLTDYAWNEQVFKVIPAGVAREVRFKYWRNLDTISSESFNITILNAQLFLEYMTGAIFCMYPGGLPKKGADLAAQADRYWKLAANIETKTMQALPVRRRGYRSYSRR